MEFSLSVAQAIQAYPSYLEHLDLNLSLFVFTCLG
jgi:hypothetical protein